jgi:hypothetical protein
MCHEFVRTKKESFGHPIKVCKKSTSLKKRAAPLTPYCLDPALIRVIHNDRMSLFFTLLSLNAYCKLFSTLSLEILMQFLARPLKPFASLKIFALFIILSKFIYVSLPAEVRIHSAKKMCLLWAPTLK